MHKILDEYERGEKLPGEVEQAIQFHMEGLEALPYERIKEAGRLCHRLVTADLTDGEEQFIECEAVSAVLRDFRAFLNQLPTKS
jgi:hypothetical protein